MCQNRRFRISARSAHETRTTLYAGSLVYFIVSWCAGAWSFSCAFEEVVCASRQDFSRQSSSCVSPICVCVSFTHVCVAKGPFMNIYIVAKQVRFLSRGPFIKSVSTDGSWGGGKSS